jgi:hypothetical protein
VPILVIFSGDDIPSEARRVMDQAGPTGKDRDPVDPVDAVRPDGSASDFSVS